MLTGAKSGIHLVFIAILMILWVCSAHAEVGGSRLETSAVKQSSDGNRLFVYTRSQTQTPLANVYIITGYTGINHIAEQDVIALLCGVSNRVVVMHPRGTGYSDGTRGDVRDYGRFMRDYIEILNEDIGHLAGNSKVILYGHSISTAIALHLAPSLSRVDGILLVNPPCRMKSAPGMTPTMADYVKYAAYMVFAPHKPVVNMGGDPSRIENLAERTEAMARASDPLLVNTISMYLMIESKKLLDQMGIAASRSDYPLLLVYGLADSIVDREGCAEIYRLWKGSRKTFLEVPEGPHGRVTVLKARETVQSWIKSLY